MEKIIAKVLVGSRLHDTATATSDYDYRGIYIDDLKHTLSPFVTHKNTQWIEGDVDNTSYELREFCKLATKGNATILEVFFSNQVYQTSLAHKIMQDNWKMFMNTHNFIAASRGYATNQYKKALSYDDLGESGQIRTAKFVISFLRVMWQCEQYLLYDRFECSLKKCPEYDFIKTIKGLPRGELDIPLCFKHMEEMNHRLYLAEEYCLKNTPDVYTRTPNIEFIEDFLYQAYTNPELTKPKQIKVIDK